MAGSSRSALAVAARRLLEERLVPVEVLGVALREYEAAQTAAERAVQEREEKAAACRAAHAGARDQGWTAAELRQLGLEPPAAPRRRRESTDDEGAGAGGEGEAGSVSAVRVAHPVAAQDGGTNTGSDEEELQR